MRLGTCKIFTKTNKIPDYDSLECEKCYFEWEVLLVSDCSSNEIADVFIFVEDDSKLEIQLLANYNILEYNEIVNEIEQKFELNNEIQIDNLKYIVEQHASKNNKTTIKKDSNSLRNNHSKQGISSVRVDSDKLDRLMNLVSELVTTQARLGLFAESQELPELTAISENIQKLTRELRDNAFSIVLIPIETMITRFQRLVRDLSVELGKKVAFVTSGLETELDKTLIENLLDPIMHILRNSMDHGLETPEERIRQGKPLEGKITFKAYHYGANVYIEIADDGKGINKQAILKKAIESKIIHPDQNLTEKEIFELLFKSGLSTATKVTDVSGRGVGMDVVRKKINEIRGEIEIESELGKGTKITIKLPLTLSIIDGLLVKIHNNFYIMPLGAVNKIIVEKHKKLANTYNNTLPLDGKQVVFFNLREEFGLPETEEENEEIIIVNYEDEVVGFTVDNVVGEYQAVLKPLGKYYKNQEIISGATILGDGTVALVIDTNKTIRKFTKQLLKDDRNV
ncbi:MAG: chemotaxis protein CheA [Bacteroidales bacterium]|nr:chemotaxis protein CheA [Bacteroidales bacterium]